MAISAQDLNIPLVSLPISETACPVIHPFLWGDFGTLIYMVNVEHPNVIVPAMYALPAKLADKFYFSFPVATLLLKVIALLVPKVFLAVGGTKLSTCGFPAVVTCSGMPPTRGVITGGAAKSHPCFAAIGLAKRNIKFLMTILTRECYSVFSHTMSITALPMKYKVIDPTYFAIAERRIQEAQMQPRLI